MEKAGYILLASFLALQLLIASSNSPDLKDWLSIDCGINDIRWEDLILWDVDSEYTQTGSNKNVQESATRQEFNTLRYFPNKTQQNCYILPAKTQTIRYMIRAGFYYGNYDGLDKPPMFDLFINDAKWTTINTSKNNGQPLYEEIIYENNGSGFFKLCLVQIAGGGVPLINSIETVPLWDKLYPEMESNATYNLVARINYGGDEIRSEAFDFDEMYNRIWSKELTPLNYTKLVGFTDVTSTYENNPPLVVLMDSIESNSSDPIILIVDFPQLSPQTACFVFYITELLNKNPNQTRTIKIEINGQDQGTVVGPSMSESTVITKYPVMVSGPTLNITLTRGNQSSLPPVIAAMEVFTKWDADKPQPSAAAQEYFPFGYSSTTISFMLLLWVL